MSIDIKPKPRVLYDISVLGASQVSDRAKTGVYRVVENIARYLLEQSDIDLSWTAFGNPEHLYDVVKLLRDDPTLGRPLIVSLFVRRLTDALSAPIDYLAATHLYPLVRPALPIVKRLREKATFNSGIASRYDLIHSPFHALPEIDHGGVCPARVLTVYDLIPVKFPSFFESGVAERLIRAIGGLTKEDWVLCISESTRDDLLNYRVDLNPARVRVTPLAAAEHFTICDDVERQQAVRHRLGIPAKAQYFLSVCTLEPRKNLRHLLTVFERMRKHFDDDTYLVLAGAKGWHIDELINGIGAGVEHKVIATGFVAESDLAPLYSDAIAFVYPSLYEGFGLPPLEAMQCGTPVITSNNSSLPEVVGEAGILVSAESTDELATAMLRLYNSQDLRRSLALAGLERSKQFSWERCGRLTMNTYLDALSART